MFQAGLVPRSTAALFLGTWAKPSFVLRACLPTCALKPNCPSFQQCTPCHLGLLGKKALSCRHPRHWAWLSLEPLSWVRISHISPPQGIFLPRSFVRQASFQPQYKFPSKGSTVSSKSPERNLKFKGPWGYIVHQLSFPGALLEKGF